MIYLFFAFTFFSFFNSSLLYCSCSKANPQSLIPKEEKALTDLQNLQIKEDTPKAPQKTSATKNDVTKDSMIGSNGVYADGL